VRIMPDVVVWKDYPAFPKGVKIATLVGDPTKVRDAVVLRLKSPAHFQIHHTRIPTLRLIGSSHGEQFQKTGILMRPGALWVCPERHPHYAWTEDGEAILQVQLICPGGIDYSNPADDPRKSYLA